MLGTYTGQVSPDWWVYTKDKDTLVVHQTERHYHRKDHYS